MRLRYCGLLVSALGLPAATLAQAPAASLMPSGQLINQGVALHDEGKYDEAAARYRLVLPGDSAYAYAQSELALSLMQAEKYPESVEAARRALQRDPFEPVTYSTLANDYEGLKKPAEARQTYADGLKLFPYNENLWINQAVLELNQKQMGPALASLKRALELKPGKSSEHRLLGKAAAMQGQLAHTLISLATFLLIEPEGEQSQPVLVELERLSVGIPLVEPADQVPPVSPNTAFEELDQLIAAKVALMPTYVSKVKFKAAIVKQMQLVVEKFPVDADPASDLWVRQYAPLVRALRQGDNLTAFTYLILSSASDRSAAQWVKGNKAKIEKLYEDLAEPLLSIRKLQPLAGAAAPVPGWFGEGNLLTGLGPGERDAKGSVTPSGSWAVVGKAGDIEERGSFDANHKRTGKWVRLQPDGVVVEETTYANGELDGPLRRYYPGGQLKEEQTYRAGKVEGVMKTYAEAGYLANSRAVAKGDFEGDAVDYYANQQPSFKSQMHADQKNGVLERYYPDGAVQLHSQYAQNKAQGDELQYYPDKTLKLKIAYDQDEPHGSFTSYFANGKVRETGQLTRGKRTGQWKEYFVNGQLSVERSYDEAGQLHGTYRDYDYQGRLYGDTQYEHGRMVRTASLDASGKPRLGADYVLKKGRTATKSYDAEGHLLSAGEVENGQMVGEWKTYYPDGTVRDVVHYDAKGIRTGEGLSYYATGQLHQRRFYNDQGETHGYLEQFYVDGQPKQSGYELNGEDEGVWKTYYPDGHLSQEREMHHAVLSGQSRSYSVGGQVTDEQQYLYGLLKQVTAHDSTGRVLSQQDLAPTSRELLAYFPGLPGKQVLNRCAMAGNEYNGPITWLWPGGRPETTLAMLDGRRYGLYRRSYPDGQPEIERTFLNGKLYGPATSYYPNGTPSAKGRYLDGETVGEWTTYYPNGKVQRVLRYNDEGETDGPTRLYNPAGELLVEYRFEQGRLVGWAGPGATPEAVGAAQALAPAGGAIKTTFANGKLAAEQAFAHGYPSGPATFYYASGQVFRREAYEKGLLSGPVVAYYPNGKPMREENYQHGELHGRCRYYRPDGTLEREQSYQVGERSGPWVYYDAQGKAQHRYLFWNDALYSGQ